MRRGLAILAAFLVGSGALRACSVCLAMSGDGLLLPDPQALEIAQATREAGQAGLLATDPAGIPLATMAKFWSRKQALEPLGTVHLLAVDSAEKCALRTGPGGTEVTVNTSGPADSVVVTTRRTLQTMIDGKLTLDDAVARKLARVDRAGAETKKVTAFAYGDTASPLLIGLTHHLDTIWSFSGATNSVLCSGP